MHTIKPANIEVTSAASAQEALRAEPVALSEPTPAINDYMAARLDRFDLPKNLREAIGYALLAGGKRGRPVLLVQCCRAVGGEAEAALPAAMAIELIHSFSLVHDDLPAMDNDDLRRGKPTVHKKFGEAMGILVGDAMMSLAFQILSPPEVSMDLVGPLARELAQGTTAMIAGQVYDTLGGFTPDETDASRLNLIHRNKTGALIRSACRMGAIVGRADEGALDGITRYGEAVGLIFQIVDDLLDIEQTVEHTGKRTNKDAQAGKLTYPAVHGAPASRARIEDLRQVAQAAIEPLGAKAAALAELCDFLAVRTK